MSDYDINQKLAIARAVTGKISPEQNGASEVALAILQQQEGSMASPKTAPKTESMKTYSPEFKKMQRMMGISDNDLALLPDDIETMIQNSLGSAMPRA